MRIKIEKFVYPGKALGRSEDGIATFAEELLPDEIAEVNIVKDKKSFREARLDRLVKKSKYRITPPCPIYSKCGGCSLQFSNYEHQLRLKKTALADQFRNLVVAEFLPVIASPELFHYRNKFEFSFFQDDDSIKLGLMRKDNPAAFLATPFCYIAAEEFVELTEPIRNFANQHNLTNLHSVIMRKSTAHKQIMLNFICKTGRPQPIMDVFIALGEALRDKVDSIYYTELTGSHQRSYAEPQHVWGIEQIMEVLKIGKHSFSFALSPLSFFQTNTRVAEILCSKVMELIAPRGNETILDLYCGSGMLGLTLAPHVRQVHGVDQEASAINDAVKNQHLNQIENIKFIASSVEQWLQKSPIPKYDILIVDPPRQGLDQNVYAFIRKAAPQKIVYVSCDQATLVRDLKRAEFANYQIKTVMPLDMFPQTYHLETICLLEYK